MLLVLTLVEASALAQDGSAPEIGDLPSFQLTTSLRGTNTLPFTIGLPLPKGKIGGAVHLNVMASSCSVMRTWNDGSDKHVICSGRASLTQNRPVTVSLVAGPGTGTVPLSCADIANAAPTAAVNLGAAGAVSLSALLARPFRSYVSSTEMADCHYKGTASSGLTVFFYVRLYQDHRMFVRVAVDNGWVDQDLGNLSYTPTVAIGGDTVFNPGPMVHYNHTRWTATGWIGGDPQITPKHDTTYLVSTKLVPNYFMDAPSSAKLNNLYQSYAYATLGDGEANERGTGAQFQIGLLPGWDALYITSRADSRAYRAVLANAAQEFGFGLVFRTHSDNDLVVRPSNQPARTCTNNTPGGDGGESGSCGFGATIPGGGTLTWDLCHSSNSGYIAYMITGEYFYAELLQMKSAVGYLTDGNTTLGTNRNIFHVAVRCPAWHLRTIASLVAIAPLDSVNSDYQALLFSNATFAKKQVQTAGMNRLGILYEYDLFTQNNPPSPPCHGVSTCSLFMEFFMVQTFGFVSDIEPLASMADWNVARDYQYQIPANLLGAALGTDFCYSWAAGEFDYKYSTLQVMSVTDANFPANWGGVWKASKSAGLNDGVCSNSLRGTSGSDPANGPTTFWSNLLPAASYAVDHGFPSAQAGLNRLTGASNYSAFRNSTNSGGFANYPNFGIQPRGRHL